MLTALKGIPLAYNKDLQEDKECASDSFDQLSLCLVTFTAMLKSITFNTKNMNKAAGGGYSAATDVADYLAKKGLPFRDAHAVTGAIVRSCIEKNITLDKMSAVDYKAFSPLFNDDITDIVKIKNVVEARKAIGGTAKPSVQSNIKSLKKRLTILFKQ
jgi:argininosuccinate lyase